jgi:hypothetical protein
MDELLQGVDPLLYLAPLQNPQVDSARGCEGRRRCQFDVSRGAGITEDERRRPNRTPDLHFKRRKIARTPPWSRTHAKTPLPFTPDIRRAHTWERSGRSGRGTPSPACRCSAGRGVSDGQVQDSASPHTLTPSHHPCHRVCIAHLPYGRHGQPQGLFASRYALLHVFDRHHMGR